MEKLMTKAKLLVEKKVAETTRIVAEDKLEEKVSADEKKNKYGKETSSDKKKDGPVTSSNN